MVRLAAGFVPLLHPWIDASQAPFYVLTFPVEPSDELLTSCCEARERWATVASYKVAWMVDLSNMRHATPRQRRMFGEHLKRFEYHNVKYNVASALVVPNAMLRGIVTAAFWFAPPKFPHQFFATRESASEWALGRLRREA